METRKMNFRLCRIGGAVSALNRVAVELEELGFNAEVLTIASESAQDYLASLQTPSGHASRRVAVQRAIARSRGEPDPLDRQIRIPF